MTARRKGIGAVFAGVVAAFVLLVGAESASAAISCTNLSGNLRPGQWNCTVDNRDVNVFVPNSYTGSTAVPLIVDMHGFTSNNDSQQNVSGWDTLASSQNFIVAYPQGVSNSWNAQGQCCGSSTANDVQFIRDVVAAIRSSANIDSSTIYATGLSNGGSMTHTLLCQASDLFTGGAAVSFGLSGGSSFNAVRDNCKATYTRGIPEVEFHGTSDSTVDYNNGVLDALGSPDTLEAWRQIVGASTATITTNPASNTSCQIHTGGINGASVALCTVQGGTHVLYPDTASPGIARIAWDYLQSHRTVGGSPPPPPPPPPGNCAGTLLNQTFDGGLAPFTSAGPVMGGTFGGTDGSIRSGNINTTGCNTVTLAFDRVTSGTLDSGENGIAEYSTNGGSSFTQVEATRTSTRARVTFTLAGAGNITNLQLRFRVSSSLSSETYTVDNITVTGS
jgi:polyhydroxybutyrate depolymerase